MLAQEHSPKWKPSGPTAATAMQVSLCPKQVVLADCIPTKEVTLGSLNSLPKGRHQARPGPGGAGQQHLPPPGEPDLGEGQTAPEDLTWLTRGQSHCLGNPFKRK